MARKSIFGGLRSLRTPLLLGTAIGLVVLGMPSAQASTSGDTEHITVTQELVQDTEDQQCMNRDGMTWSRQSTDTTFEIVVTLERPLCDRLEAAAVIYLMPEDGSLWPQTLSEEVDITFLEAGVTTIVWEKFCVPAQFDLLEPPAPEVINVPPIGPFHGPLVFPPTNIGGNNGSATQYLGGGPSCDTTTSTTTTTTSTTTTTTSTTTTTTTTLPEGSNSIPTPNVEGVTTTVLGSPASTGQPLPTVGGSTAANSGGGATLSVAG
jgi:hypothetical protein